jgi:LacI family transcriptional regulator
MVFPLCLREYCKAYNNSAKAAEQKHLKITSGQTMKQAYPLKEIASQAGLSLATVDRVLHGRSGVSSTTHRRVKQALRELARQSESTALNGRKFMIDIVMEAPARFTTLVAKVLEAEMPFLQPAVFRSRFHFAEEIPTRDLVQILSRIAKRGSNGVILKAPDTSEITQAIAHLSDAKIPVVTLVTDIPNSRRFSYVGIDNRAAGATAAYLIGEWLADTPAQVLVTLSSSRFRGEEEREIGFRRALRESYPHLTTIEISEGFGRDRATGPLVREALEKSPGICAVYSIGGGNSAILAAFNAAKRNCRVFIGHDLDLDNLRFLRDGKISAVLHHDLRQDMRMACQHIMRANDALPRIVEIPLSSVSVITPFNIPDGA